MNIDTNITVIRRIGNNVMFVSGKHFSSLYPLIYDAPSDMDMTVGVDIVRIISIRVTSFFNEYEYAPV
jgi:hypothetical protein